MRSPVFGSHASDGCDCIVDCTFGDVDVGLEHYGGAYCKTGKPVILQRFLEGNDLWVVQQLGRAVCENAAVEEARWWMPGGHAQHVVVIYVFVVGADHNAVGIIEHMHGRISDKTIFQSRINL